MGCLRAAPTFFCELLADFFDADTVFFAVDFLAVDVLFFGGVFFGSAQGACGKTNNNAAANSRVLMASKPACQVDVYRASAGIVPAAKKLTNSGVRPCRET